MEIICYATLDCATVVLFAEVRDNAVIKMHWHCRFECVNKIDTHHTNSIIFYAPPRTNFEREMLNVHRLNQSRLDS